MTFTSPQQALNALFHAYYEEKNIEAALSCVTDDIEWVGTENSDRAKGKPALRTLLEAILSAFADSAAVERTAPDIQYLGSDAALMTVTGRQSAGAAAFEIRETFGCVQTKDGWLIANVHISVPNAETEKISLRNELDTERKKQKEQLEKELYDNHKKEETLMASIPGGVAIYHVKKDERITTEFVSESLAKMCGYTAEEFLAYLREDCTVNVVPTDAPAVAAALRQALEKEEPLSVMYHIYTKDKTPIMIRLDANTIHSENQQEDDIAVLYAVHTRVSDASKKIISEQSMLKKLVDEVPAGLGIYDIAAEKVDQIYMNEAFYTMLGTKREERRAYFHENVLLSAHPEDIETLRDAIRILQSGKQKTEVTYRVKNGKDSWFWIHLSASVVEREGDHLLAYGSFTDYNQIKEAEQRNALEQQRFRTVADEMNAAVFEWNLNENSFYSSTAYRKYAISQVSSNAVLHNRGLQGTVHPDDLAALKHFFAGTLSGTPRVEATLRMKLTEGGYHWCRIIGLFYRNEKQEPTKIVGILLDVNDEHEENVKLQTLLDEIPGGIGRYDYYQDKLELTYMNDAYFAMLGMERQDRIQYTGIKTVMAVHPEDAVKTIDTVRELAAGKSHADIYQRVHDGKGNWRWMKFATAVTDRTDGHTRMIAAITDCDELIRTQETLQNRYDDQVRYARMVASDAVSSSMVNLTKQTVALQNADNEDLVSLISCQTPQQGFDAMCACIPDARIQAEYKDIFHAAHIIADFAQGITHKSIRHPYQNFDCWYESTYDALRNPKTNDLEVYCVARDISQEIQDEQVSQCIMSQAYEEVMLIHPVTGEPKILVENSRSGVYEEQKKTGDYSRGLEQYILNCSADEHPERVAEALGLKAVKQALETQDSYTVSYSLYDTQNKLVHRSASYTYLNQYHTRLLCVIRDVTDVFEKERRQREALQLALEEAGEASRAKADFYSRMSHDMRTPMNGILGMAELSEEETDSTKLKANIKKIQESGEYLLSLVNDTLDIQRIESGKMVLEPKLVRTQDVVGNILDMVRVAAAAKGVTLKYTRGNTDLNGYIRADALRLKQIFVNLLSNAVKFTPAGGTVELEFRLLSREGMISHDVIYVRDTGVGMSKKFLQEGIFKPFSQENNAVSTQYAGSGLGLSIAKSLVELMQGRIEVESELGVGTTFTVFLDFERVSDTEAERAVQSQKKQKADLTTLLEGKHILLAEDHPLNAEIAQRLLQRVGCTVLWAKDGQQAVSRFAEAPVHTFDAVLMDIRMPVMDGLEAARQIRALPNTDAAEIPIIAMTANAYEEDIQASLRAGMNAHLGKPIESKNLYQTLAELIGNSGAL